MGDNAGQSLPPVSRDVVLCRPTTSCPDATAGIRGRTRLIDEQIVLGRPTSGGDRRGPVGRFERWVVRIAVRTEAVMARRVISMQVRAELEALS